MKEGYIIVDLSQAGKGIAGMAKRSLMAHLGELESCQQEVTPEARDIIKNYPRLIVEAEMPFFHALIGKDLHIQRKPYLRISRPGVMDDNIGVHRDTWYGDSPYELSVWIPLTDTSTENALLVAPGSHVWREEELEPAEPQADKGSPKHSLGYLYAPKRLTRQVDLKPLPVRVGQMIVFSLSLLHGQEVNQSSTTRVSMDVRVANSLAPIKWERSKENYYEELSISPVRKEAMRYYQANEA